MRRILLISLLLLFAFTSCAGSSSQDASPTPGSLPPSVSTSQTAVRPAMVASPTVGTSAQPSSRAITAASTPTALAVTAAPTPATTIASAAATRVTPLAGQISLPSGFGISVFAAGLDTPRNLAIGPDGQLYVAERGAGRIVRLPDRNHDGLSDGLEVIAEGLSSPSSLAFYKDGSLYVSTPTQVFRLNQPDANGDLQKRELVIDGLPSRQGHFTRTLLFSPDWSSLFIQVGSSCNVCNESDPRRATIMHFNADGSSGEVYARGLRNAVGITFRPGTNELWATNNGTDNLGDNQPPDTIQIVQKGQDYGWPRCHAGSILDPQFGGPGSCNGVAKPLVNLQAHSAALGLTFYTGTQFPAEYRGDLFVALHGSIYRTVPTGYKVVRIHFTNGQPGPAQDFAAGWLPISGRVWGRPVDVVTAPDGSLFVSDDSEGIIYRIFYAGG